MKNILRGLYLKRQIGLFMMVVLLGGINVSVLAQNLDEELPNPATKSILFTGQEFSALREARNYTGAVRPLDSFENFEEEEVLQLPPQDQRFITLGGILYKSGKAWTIWLNGQRVTPDALPEEVLDLRVFKNYVEMRWYDVYTKRIIPVRLRTNQRFHMDARIFLPG